MPLSSSSAAAAADPFELLSQKITPAAKKTGSIKISSNLFKAVKSELKTVRTSKAHVPDAGIITLVSALDEYNETCSRLESMTFGLVLQTLLHAGYSRQKERGILLLTASLHHDAHKTPPLRTMRARKTAIGKECLQLLISYFTNALEDARIRKWVGVLIIQLFEGCDPNRMVFEGSPEDSKRKLGTMVVEEQNELVRITCGQLLRALVAWKVPIENLWPIGTDPMRYKNFPPSSQNEKHWNNAFQAYVDEQFASSNPLQDSGRIYFAQALITHPTGTQISGCTINIFVDRDISICTQSTDISFAESIEIPFQLISTGKIVDTLLESDTQSENPPVDLVVNLKTSGEISCYRNALPVNISEIRFTILNEGLAHIIGEDFLEQISSQKASQSKDNITIAPIFHDGASEREGEIIQDSNEERTKSQHDSEIVRPSDKTQSFGQSVGYETIIKEPPQDDQVPESNTRLNPKHREVAAEDAHPAVAPMYGTREAEDPGMVADGMSRQLSAPGRLSHETEVNLRASTDKENDRRHNASLEGQSSHGTGLAKADLEPSDPKLTLSDPSNKGGSEELSDPHTSSVESPLEFTEPKINSKRSNAKRKPPEKKKIRPKPAVPREEAKKEKKYSLKPKVAAPTNKTTAPKRVTAPRAKASVSKAGREASTSKSASVPELVLTPQTISALAAKDPKKRISKLLIPKKPAVKNSSKSPAHQSPAHFSEPETKSQERETMPTRANKQSAISFELNIQGGLMKGETVTNRQASRLSAALATIKDVEKLDASVGELLQTSFIYEPPQVSSQTESSPSPTSRSPVRPAKEEIDSPRQFNSEGMVVPSKIFANQPSHTSIRSESSPSPLVRVTPVPLPALEANSLEYLIPEATPVQPQSFAVHTGPRRSPRFALPDNTWDSATALSTSSVAADEKPLLDEHLARKTPLVSFGATGPRNQGIASSKMSRPLQKRVRQVEKPEKHPLLTYTRIHAHDGKRKRDEGDPPVEENNKRQQTSKAQRSKAIAFEVKVQTPHVSSNMEDHVMPVNPPVARQPFMLGSQGLRINEYGSPLRHSTTLQEHENYKAIARKVLTDVKSPAMTGEDGDDFSNDGDDEGLFMVESDQGFLPSFPAPSSSSFKVRPLSPRPGEEIVKRYLPRPKTTHLRHAEIETRGVPSHHTILADPFLKESRERDLSNIARRLQYRRQIQTRRARDDAGVFSPRKKNYTMNEDLEATLVNVENRIPVQETFSLSDITSQSSEGFQDLKPRISATEAHQAHLDEWRMALKPHQRGVLDVLFQVSADLVRYLIGHELAVEDVLTEYETEGMKLIKEREKGHQEDRRRIRHEVDRVMKTMGNEYRESRREMSRIAEALRARPVRELEKEWMREQDQMQRIIEEGTRNCR